MDTKKYGSSFYKNRPGSTTRFEGIKDGIRIFAIGIAGLLALGLFMSSQRLNAG